VLKQTNPLEKESDPFAPDVEQHGESICKNCEQRAQSSVAGLETKPSGRELQFWNVALALAVTWNVTHDMAEVAFARQAIASALRWRSMAPYAGFLLCSTVFLACVVHDS
jgi:hypothetical protein